MKQRLLTLILLFLVPAFCLAQTAEIEEYRGTLKVGHAAKIGNIHMGALTSRTYTTTNNDAQNNTLTVAELVGGITVHTSTSGGGTVTTDTAANIIAGSAGEGELTQDGQCYMHFYVNDGTQTLTFAGGDNVTVSDTGNTILTNEAAILLVCRASSTTVTVHLVTS